MIEIFELLWSYRSRSLKVIRLLFGNELTRPRVNEFSKWNFGIAEKQNIEITTEEAKAKEKMFICPGSNTCHVIKSYDTLRKWNEECLPGFILRKHVFFGVFCITTELICAPINIILNPSDNWRWSMQIWWMVHFNLDVSFIRRAQIEIFRSPQTKKNGKKGK